MHSTSDAVIPVRPLPAYVSIPFSFFKCLVTKRLGNAMRFLFCCSICHNGSRIKRCCSAPADMTQTGDLCAQPKRDSIAKYSLKSRVFKRFTASIMAVFRITAKFSELPLTLTCELN